ncbi:MULTISPECIES: response regulator transcription factor [Achromobacter]|uniref:DNA-binding response regulator n=2 Tax=Achromobacter TaxID=222 RepID=A0A2S0I1J3_9BURK|nr:MULTISPECIES: response regulator transcription factor [Achromobacter]AVJ25896.1 DNA-binding response regulator [Achromobacter spanius]CAB3707191.1 Transcriptional activator protein CopR [Achromobacter animicus]
MRILLIEDDSKVSYWLASKFQASGHQCVPVDSGEQALIALDRQVFDIAVLDRMLPGIDGIEVLRRLQGRPHPPVIILSAVDQASDRVEGLRAGAQDHIGKPFDFLELMVRMELLVQRHDATPPNTARLCVQDLQIDLLRRKVTRSGRDISLTDKEFLLLRTLAEHAGQTVPRGMLLEKVWGLQFDPQTNLIDVHVSKLRSKIDKDFAQPLLKTVRAMGYVLS